MTYTTEQKNAAAHLLCQYFPHLHFGVARTWVSAEGGANNNVFGVTIAGKLQSYPTVEAGVKAAAARINTLLVYRNLRDAFNSAHTVPTGCPGFSRHATSQASAICHSPWNTGVAGLREQGGVSRYYLRIFRANGYQVVV